MRRDKGFVLLLVLATLVVLSLLAAAIAANVERAVADQARANADFQARLETESTRATLLYLATSRRHTFGGQTIDDAVVRSDGSVADWQPGSDVPSYTPLGNEVRLDGSVYQGLGNARFALQDERGKISINFSDRRMLERWLEGRDVEPQQRQALLATLLDYQDPDEFTRLGGAEAPDYLEAGLPPPPNRTLLTPVELRRVMGWGPVLAGVSDAELVAAFTVSRTALVNINTADAGVLASMPGWNADIAERIIQSRASGPLPDTVTLRRLVAVMPADADSVILYPGDTFTLTTWSSLGGAALHEQWQLTPMEEGGRPWRTLYRLWMPRPEPLDADMARPTGAPVFGDAGTSDR
ncbi:general secretion pathway protein GspK [Arenimonas sp.]|uniref:general secretion pathway protein GspK n=1 Tax=Arenimonas sp. TaxID=1872635 RepID=UPI0035B24462